MTTRLRWVLGALTACALILATVGLAHIPIEAIAPTETPDFERVCDAVLTRAIAFTEERCGATGRNEVCYGYTDVTAAFQPNVDETLYRFEFVGDIVPLGSLARIETESLNLEEATWGMAILKLQANLPDTNPGQNVTFLLFGKTSLRTSEAQTNAFYLSTELGALTCNQIPSSSLVVRAPRRVEVAFTLNDVQIRLASTLVFSAEGSMLRIKVLEGHARVTAGGITRDLVAGQELTVPLNPETGAADGPPSEPVTLEYDPAMESVGALVDSVSGEAQGGLVILEGPIELIDIEGGWITVDGRRLRMDPAALARLRVGQPFVYTGYMRGFSVVRPPQSVAGSADGPTPIPTNVPAQPPVLPPVDTVVPTETNMPTPINTPENTPENTPINTPINTPENTPENTPINTPINTPENTPINTPINTPEPVLDPLSLVALCSPDPASYRVWSVLNPNPVDVEFTWNVRNSEFEQAGTDTAKANGSTGFTTVTEQGSNTVEIWVDGKLNDSQSGNANQCP